MPRYDKYGNVIPGTENEEKEYDDDSYTVVDNWRDDHSIQNPNNQPQKVNEEVEFNFDDNEIENISNQLDKQAEQQIQENKIEYPTYDQQIELHDGTQDTLTVFDENTINNFSIEFDEKAIASVNYKQYNLSHQFFGAKTPERRSKNTERAIQNALDLMPLKTLQERLPVDQFFYDFDRTKPGHEAAKKISKMMDTYVFLGQLLNTNYAELSTTRLIQINQTLNTLLGKNGKESISELISQFDRATDFEYSDNPAVKAMHDVAAKLDQAAAVLERGATLDYNMNVQEKVVAQNELHQAIEAQNKNIEDLNRLLVNGGITTPFDEMEDDYKKTSKQAAEAEKKYYASLKILEDSKQFLESDEYKTWDIQVERIKELEKKAPKLSTDAKEHTAIVEKAKSIRESTEALQRSAEIKADEAKAKLDKLKEDCQLKEQELFNKISFSGQKIYTHSITKKREYQNHLESIRDTNSLDDKYVSALENPENRDGLLRDPLDTRRAFSKACFEFADQYDREHPRSFFSKAPTGYDVLKGLLKNYKETKDINALKEALKQPMLQTYDKFVSASQALSRKDQLAIGEYDDLCYTNGKLIDKATKEYTDLAKESMLLRAKIGEQTTILNNSIIERQKKIDEFSKNAAQIEKIKKSWTPEFLNKIAESKKIVETYPDIVKGNRIEATKLSLKKTALSQGIELVGKIKNDGQFAREKYEKFMSIKHVKAFSDTKFEDIHAKLESFNARINDKKGSHKNSDEYTAMTNALDKALKSNANNLSENLMELKRKSQEYLDAKHGQTFVIGSKLRHTRLNFAEELKGFADQYSKLYAESKPINLPQQQLDQLSLEESSKPNIKALGDVKFPTEKQVEKTMKELEERLSEQYNVNKEVKKEKQVIKNDNKPNVNLNI